MENKLNEENERKKILFSIHNILYMKNQGSWPTTTRMAFCAIIGMPVGSIIGIYANQYQGWLIVLSLLVGGAIGHFTSKYKTWDEIIYEKMTNYQPVNKEAYREIQKLAAEDKLTSDDLLEWVNAELEVISPRKDTSADMARKRFASK